MTHGLWNGPSPNRSAKFRVRGTGSTDPSTVPVHSSTYPFVNAYGFLSRTGGEAGGGRSDAASPPEKEPTYRYGPSSSDVRVSNDRPGYLVGRWFLGEGSSGALWSTL